MTKVVIYTKDYCPFCTRAKSLLEKKGVEYQEFDISLDSALRSEMLNKANGRTTVPQIFIGNYHVGGYDDLSLADANGELDKWLQQEGDD